MLKLLDRILEHVPNDFVTDTEIAHLVPAGEAARHNQVKRALANHELIRIRRGLYQLAPRYQRRGVGPYEIANRVYGPSYVSFESALSYHGLIPEAVQRVSSASARRAREFRTPAGIFEYIPIPMAAFGEGFERIAVEGTAFLIASPLKALADYVYVRRHEWEGLAPLLDSLRIDPGDLIVAATDWDSVERAYSSARIRRFLRGLRRDLEK